MTPSSSSKQKTKIVKSTLQARRQDNELHVAELFHLIDKDGSQSIEIRELLSALKKPDVLKRINEFEPLKFLLKGDEVEKTFKKMDKGDDSDDDSGDVENDGLITYTEFRSFCMHLLRRQCVQYIMPRHVESMHLRDDLDHDEEHDEVGVKGDDGGLNYRSGNNNINVDEW